MSKQPKALRLANRPIIDRGFRWHTEATTTLRRQHAENERLHAVNAELLEALRQSADLAEYWFLREDRRNLSDSEYKTWHSLGYGSSAYKAARAAHAKAEGK